jgi:hypothetical protein
MKINRCRYKRLFLAGATLFLAAGICLSSFAAGLRVSPGALSLQHAAVGEETDLEIEMLITNYSETERMFLITPQRPSKVTERWLKGYAEIPDPDWFYFDQDRIRIGPGEEARVGMHLNIPDQEEYYNQRWVVYVDVTTETEEGETFKAAVRPNYMIETLAKEDVEARPYGELGLAPSVVRPEEVETGRRTRASFRLYNNEETRRTYTLNSYIPQATRERQDISGSPGYQWIEDENWVRPARRRVRLGPGQVREVALNILVPEGKEAEDLGWEAIVLVEPDEGLSGFIRVLIEP